MRLSAPPGVVTSALIAETRHLKSALLDLITPPPSWIADRYDDPEDIAEATARWLEKSNLI